MAEIFDSEAAFLHPDMPVEMLIEWPTVIVDLDIITKEFIEEYCILLVNSIYGNVNAYLLWLRLFAKYLTKECDMTKIQAGSYIFYNNYDGGKFELVISLHVDHVFMAGRPETLEKIK